MPDTMPIPDGSVVITPAKMYAELREMRTSIDRLANTVDPSLTDLRGDLATQAAALTEERTVRERLATRLTIVETKIKVVWALVSVELAGCGALAAVTVALHR